MKQFLPRGLKQKCSWFCVISRNCDILLLNYDKVIAQKVFDVRKFYFMKIKSSPFDIGPVNYRSIEI